MPTVMRVPNQMKPACGRLPSWHGWPRC